MSDMNELMPQKGWWGRNWKWAIPTFGCGGFIVVFIAIFGVAIFGATSFMSKSQPYQEALTLAKSNPETIAILGEPIETNGIMQGSLNIENGQGDITVNIPIKGPKGEASVFVVGEKRGDIWTYSEMEVRFKNSEKVIELLEPKE